MKRTICRSLLLPLALVGVWGATFVLLASTPAHASTTQVRPHSDTPSVVAVQGRGVETCFGFASWDASLDLVPCYTLTPPQEDGSGALYIGTLSNDKAVCVIPNVDEERNRFTIQCRKVPLVGVGR